MGRLDAAATRFCKDILRLYPLLKQELFALENEKQRAAGNMDTFNRYRLHRLEERWHRVRFYVEAVEDVLADLDDTTRRMVEMKYFKGVPVGIAAPELGMSESTLFRSQKQVTAKLAHRLGL